jgi:hypothetical protein
MNWVLRQLRILRRQAALTSTRVRNRMGSDEPGPTADHGLDLRRHRHTRRPRGRLGPGSLGGEGPSARQRMPFVPPMRRRGPTPMTLCARAGSIDKEGSIHARARSRKGRRAYRCPAAGIPARSDAKNRSGVDPRDGDADSRVSFVKTSSESLWTAPARAGLRLAAGRGRAQLARGNAAAVGQARVEASVSAALGDLP